MAPRTVRREPGETGPVRRVGAATGRGVRASGRGVARGSSYVYRRARQASHAQGAGESGLARLIELHAVNAAGDAAVAIALAGTIFFAQPGEARGQVALFLALTMLPFALIAPLIGPFLDRYGHGRRWAIGATFAIRAVCAIVLAGAITEGSPAMYLAALLTLVASKAYQVTRAAAVPRLLPSGLTLVKANSRLSLAGIVGGAVGAPLAAGAALISPEWTLWFGFAFFAGGTVLAILLPAQADSSLGEQEASVSGRPSYPMPSSIVFSLRCNIGLRVLSGFLTMYMAFLLRQEPLPGWEDRATLLMALVIGAAGLGNAVAIGLGNLLRSLRPAYTCVTALVANAAMSVVTALFYNLTTAVLLGLVAGIGQGLGKLSLDAQIQAEVPDRVRTSVFARSETVLQLAWVIGGFIGIALPLVPVIGLGTSAVLMVGWTVFVVVRRPRAGDRFPM